MLTTKTFKKNLLNVSLSSLKLSSFMMTYIIFTDQPEVHLSRDREKWVIREGEDLS